MDTTWLGERMTRLGRVLVEAIVLHYGRDELLRRASLPLRALRGYRALRREARDLVAEVGVRARAIGELAGWAIQPASETPINGRLGPHRKHAGLLWIGHAAVMAGIGEHRLGVVGKKAHGHAIKKPPPPVGPFDP
mgnify:CR=1 FL=1